ncbi:MAG: hypothetical protein KGH79_05265, partial [Patescibacteria group bacterium]|nr:hypothetical protein [Patescibacteria group bacterium]
DNFTPQNPIACSQSGDMFQEVHYLPRIYSRDDPLRDRDAQVRAKLVEKLQLNAKDKGSKLPKGNPRHCPR